MTTDLNAIRMAEVYRLSLAGLDEGQITQQLSDVYPLVGVDQVLADLEMIRQWQEQYGDPEKIRMSLALDLDSLFHSILIELQGGWISKQSRAKAEFYREARETLMQKALLFGLNTQNVNVSQKSKLWTVIQELRTDAAQLETEANHPALPEPYYIPAASAPVDELLVESDSADGW